MLKKLAMVSIRVLDFERSLAFYRDTLGLKPAGLHDDPWCLMLLPEGDAALALDGTNPVSSGNNCIPGLEVVDLDETVAELGRRGVTFAREIEGGDEGYRLATVSDPEGNLLNLFEYTPRAAAE
jgi:catechol 2,3-dioxygenase-like lactoylglutathione lyase family enzyme